MRNLLYAMVLLLMFGCSSACERSSGPASSAPDTLKFVRPELTIGTGEKPEAAFESIRSVSVGANGLLVVADLGGRVAVFDSAGTWIDDLGSRGEGPGEYLQPASVAHVGDSIAVWDSGLRRLSFFSQTGDFLGSHDLPAIAAVSAKLDASFVAEVETGQTADPAPAAAYLLEVALEGTARDTILGPYTVPEYGWEIIDSETQRGAMVMPPVFSVRPVWTLCSGNLIWADPLGDSLVVRRLDDDSLAVIRLPLQSRPIIEDDRRSYIEAQRRRWGYDDETLRRVREQSTFSGVSPTLTGVACAPSGRIWIADFDPGVARAVDATGSTWRIVDPTGAVVAVVYFPRGFVLKELEGGKAYGVNQTELGVEYIEAYSVPGGSREGVHPTNASRR